MTQVHHAAEPHAPAASRVAGALAASAIALAAGCATRERSFAQDVDFLKRHHEAIVLASPDGLAKVVVVPAFQARVMTSTASGDDGPSYGFIKYDLVSSGETLKGITPYGGEDRFWLGPEGGQFAIFFPPGTTDFSLANWQTPPAIDTEAYALAAPHTEREAAFSHRATFTNVTGQRFDVRIDRVIRLIDTADAAESLGVTLGDARAVVFESDNRITNAGTARWTRETGMLSVWILGMFKPSPRTVALVPYTQGPVPSLGPIVNDAYFGKVPPDRLVARDGMLYFKADGMMRTKIGTSPARATPICGSYDPTRDLLTLVTFTLPAGATDYVNSMWELQDNPYAGDVVNSYNDGPSTPGGAPFGPFYELETSSPAAGLAPGDSLSHRHRTHHFTGPRHDLDRIARATLGISLDQIENALP
ncbi:MAG: hypothetical protein HRU70_05120 [Phycisphaeraceae bacterium]|nr:MAG: hypothetical protein HRU70_05120 [Phycisphaeraceae bacterium]